jgi:hypothetical protein
VVLTAGGSVVVELVVVVRRTVVVGELVVVRIVTVAFGKAMESPPANVTAACAKARPTICVLVPTVMDA